MGETFETESNKFSNSPIVLCNVALDADDGADFNSTTSKADSTKTMYDFVQLLGTLSGGSFVFWCKVNSFDGGTIISIGRDDTTADSGCRIVLRTTTTEDQFEIELDNGKKTNFTFLQAKNRWCLFVIRITSLVDININTNSVYAEVYNMTNALDSSDQTNITLGFDATDNSSPTYLDGDLAFFKFWATQISDQDIQDLYEFKYVSHDNLLLQYDFDPNDFTNDSSPYGFDFVNTDVTHTEGPRDGNYYFAKSDTRGDSFWEGYIKKFGTINRTISFPTSAFSISDIVITFENIDQFFSKNFDRRKLNNRLVYFYSGFEDQTFSQFKKVYTGVIDDFNYSMKTFSLTVKDTSRKYIDTEDYAKTIDEGDWADAEDGVWGERMPIIYGNKNNNGPCKTFRIDDVASGHKYLVAGHACKEVSEVWKVTSENVKTLLTITTDYTVDTSEVFGSDYITTITTVADLTDFEIICDVKGIEDVGDSSGVLITNPITQFEHFITTWLSLPASLYDADELEEAEELADSRNYESAGWISGEDNAEEVIQHFAFDSNGSAYHTVDGKISISIFDNVVRRGLSSTLSSVTDQDDIFKNSFKPKPQKNRACNKIIVNYGYDSFLDKYTKQYKYDDAISQTNMQKEVVKIFDLPFIEQDNSTMAQDIAQRYVKHQKYGAMQADFKTALHILNNELTDIIKITHIAGPNIDTQNGWENNFCQIQKINPNFDNMSVSISAVDVSVILFEGAFILGDEDVLPAKWTDATAAQQWYGYLCNETTEKFSDSQNGKRLL